MVANLNYTKEQMITLIKANISKEKWKGEKLYKQKKEDLKEILTKFVRETNITPGNQGNSS
jgi:hypothetical protein